MIKRFGDWLLDRGDLAIFCVNMTIPILWVTFVFGAVAALQGTFMLSEPLVLLTLLVALLSPIVLYGMYNILRYVYETTVSKS